MHFVFISTLYSPAWGGCEVLWSAAAMRALDQGHRVSVFVSERDKLESPLVQLKEGGTKLHFWRPQYSPLNFFQRVRKKLSSRGLPEWEWWHGSLPKDADVICLNQGGALCGPMRHGLTEAIQALGRPYVVLARADTGFEFLTERTRPHVRQFFEGAQAFVSASQSAIDLLRLYLPSKLPNAHSLHSPLADYGEVVGALCAGLTTDNTDEHGHLKSQQAYAWASQASAAFSNPSTSELAEDYENTSLTRSASGPALALRAGGKGSGGGNQLADLTVVLEGQSQAGLQMGGHKHQPIRAANDSAATRHNSSSVPIRDIRGFNSGALDATAPEALLACVGRLRVGDKGQHLLLACLAEEPWRSRSFRLSFYGEGPNRKYLEVLVEFYGLGDKVCLAGHTSDVAGIWKRSHLAVQPSFVEGAPQSLLEAMLCRRPCVATAVSGIPEWVEEGKTGFLAEAPTVHYLRLALERAWESRHRWPAMGEAARVACLSKRDPDPAGTLLALLRKAAQRGGRNS